MTLKLRTGASIFAMTASLLMMSNSAVAQGADVLIEEIIVTGTKKAEGESVQDAAVSITAFGAGQLEALQVRDISGLSFKMPNVALDDIGTAKGTANFTIRGLGVNSSIPSIDPAVGVFVDGVYLGINAGVIFDTFDLQSVETLRGPQGVLFGRNVTGGAVLLNTNDPSEEFGITGKLAVESGLRGTGANVYAAGTVTGSVIEDLLSLKLGVYHNDDDGWFKNQFNGENFGKSTTTLIRLGAKLTPSDNFELLLKYENGNADGQGPAAQSHRNGSGLDGQIVNFDRESFDFSIDEEGFSDAKWDQFSARADLDVGFGNGTITNIFGYRSYSQFGRSDIDATPAFLFHANFSTQQEQFSNELRYNGRFMEDKLDFTTGLFYFTQELLYGEQRDLLGGALTQDGGGIQDSETFGVFAAGDFQINDRLSINAGVRYSDEQKDVQIASLVRNVNSQCTVTEGDTRSPRECAFDFNDSFETSNWSPKVGFGYEVSDNVRLFGHWSRAFRAGGYNFRNTAIDTANFGPGPFEDERVDSFELGFKSEPIAGARLNGAVFFNKAKDLQREINLSDPVAGVVQVIRNVADADIKGFEIEATYPVAQGLVLTGSVGYTDGDYTSVTFDLNGDGSINGADQDLDLARLSPFTANAGFIYSTDLPHLGETTLNMNYAHRDGAAYTDSNLGILNPADRIDGSLNFGFGGEGVSLTIYGKNLTNDVQHGNDTQLPAVLGPVPLAGTFAPLARGRQVGVELNFKY